LVSFGPLSWDLSTRNEYSGIPAFAQERRGDGRRTPVSVGQTSSNASKTGGIEVCWRWCATTLRPRPRSVAFPNHGVAALRTDLLESLGHAIRNPRNVRDKLATKPEGVGSASLAGSVFDVLRNTGAGSDQNSHCRNDECQGPRAENVCAFHCSPPLGFVSPDSFNLSPHRRARKAAVGGPQDMHRTAAWRAQLAIPLSPGE